MFFVFKSMDKSIQNKINNSTIHVPWNRGASQHVSEFPNNIICNLIINSCHLSPNYFIKVLCQFCMLLKIKSVSQDFISKFLIHISYLICKPNNFLGL